LKPKVIKNMKAISKHDKKVWENYVSNFEKSVLFLKNDSLNKRRQNNKKIFIKKVKPDLIILDVMMPEMDGIEACEIIRNDSEIGNSLIVFLSARGEDYSQIAGFNAGADDYITKPIKPKVLKSKIKSLLRRITKEEVDLIKLGSLIVDRSGYKVSLSGKDISLPRKEFELLFLLCSKPGKVFKREFILESVWGKDVVVGDRTIDVHIRKLREKIGDSCFKTVKGVGYKFQN